MSHLTGKRVAILATDGFEQSELTEPLRALREHKADVDIVSLDGGRIQGFKHFDKGDQVEVDHVRLRALASGRKRVRRIEAEALQSAAEDTVA